MARGDTTMQSGGLLGLAVRSALVIFIFASAAATYFALRPVEVPLALLRAEYVALRARSAPANRPAIQRVLTEGVAAVSRALPAVAVAEGWSGKISVIAALILLRLLRLALSLPLLAPLTIYGLFEGLARRRHIALTTGFSSAVGFAAGKLFLSVGGLLALTALLAPATLPAAALTGSLGGCLAASAYLLARNLPLHF